MFSCFCFPDIVFQCANTQDGQNDGAVYQIWSLDDERPNIQKHDGAQQDVHAQSDVQIWRRPKSGGQKPHSPRPNNGLTRSSADIWRPSSAGPNGQEPFSSNVETKTL